MSDEAKVTPPAPPQMTPEEKQVAAIEDALACCSGVLDVLQTAVSLTVSNINNIHKYCAWLKAIQQNMTLELREIAMRNPPKMEAVK